MKKFEQVIEDIENEVFGTDPKERRKRDLGVLSINLADICNLIRCGRAEAALHHAEIARRQVDWLRETEGDA